MGAVDYVPVPVIPEVLRAKVKVFVELYRKTRQLEELNRELEQRVAERTAELEASTASLLESEQRRSVALAAGQMGSWDWDLVTGEGTWDAGQYRIFGVDPERFTPSVDAVTPLIHKDDLERIRALVPQIAQRPTFQHEFRIVRPDGEIRHSLCAGALTRDAAGAVTRISGVTIDITERKRAEERQFLLAREVDHRARNALAVVQAIVRLTRAGTVPTYISAVEGRIRALSQAHTLLSQSRWEGADIASLIEEELAPYRSDGGKRVRLAGPPVFLEPDRSQVLALALHELATNSAKYGALSSDGGKLTVSWQSQDGQVTLVWREAGGPPVRPPTEQGFGTKIINASIKHQLGGDVLLEWKPSGLQCKLSIPSAVENAGRYAPSSPEKSNLVQLSGGGAKRIMLVEDEALVGMMMRDMLVGLGFFVVGPFCSVAEARAGLEDQQFDGAILDLNLGGQMVYPIAALLETRGIPFVFATGYGEESIDGRFSHVFVMQKPIAPETLEALMQERFGVGQPGAAAMTAKAGIAGSA
jgi:PAS domain S-box-containing protein